MSRSKQVALLLFGGLLLGAIAWGFYLSIEFYEETEKSQWSVQALRNPYLAAQKFLRASDIEVVDADSLVKLDSLEGVSTVLITEASQVSNPRQLESVLAWLDKGGSLIVTANSFSTSDDLLLTEFGVDVDFPKDEEDGIDDGDEDEDEEKKHSISDSLREYNEKIDEGMTPEEIAQQGLKDVSLTEIDFGETIGTLEINFNPNRILTHAYIDGSEEDPERKPFSWSLSDYGVHLIQFDVGDGLLTIISDPGIWRSQNIDSYDHAFLLWVLSSTDGNFAFLRTIQRESLWKLITANAYDLLIALIAFTALILWYLGHRFGPVIPLDSGERRALSEHFSATANYLWHRKSINALLRPLRQQIFRRAHIAIPEFARADAGKRLELIARHCKLDRDTVGQILQSEKLNETTFVHTVKLLKQIEQSL